MPFTARYGLECLQGSVGSVILKFSGAQEEVVMKSMGWIGRFAGVAAIAAAFLAIGAGPVSAHCDTMDGPVIQAAQKALETGKVEQVLVWVQKKDEAAIREAFAKTREVRKLNPAARELADMYFFETLVRIHRAGEGAPYTGIIPAGAVVEPAVEHADKALEEGKPDEILSFVTEAVAKGIRHHFERAWHAKQHASHSVEAGREFVGAYVPYVHYVERLSLDAAMTGGHHGEAHEKKAEPAEHKHQ